MGKETTREEINHSIPSRGAKHVCYSQQPIYNCDTAGLYSKINN